MIKNFIKKGQFNQQCLNFRPKKGIFEFNNNFVNKQYNLNAIDFKLGEIPEQLKYDRHFQFSTLDNGIKVCSEYWPSPLATIAVFINTGSRDETPETSGTAHFLEHLHFKGTKNRSRIQLELAVENMGGQLNAYTSRENTSYSMTVCKKNIPQGFEILGDMLQNSLYLNNELENEKDTIQRELLETHKEFMETTIEYAHSITYKDHQMGKPILGMISNIQNVNQDMVIEYYNRNYFGKNVTIVAVGDIQHNQLEELVSQYFNVFQAQPKNGLQQINTEKPKFHGLVGLIKADLLEEPPTNLNVGIFYESPSWQNDDYFAFLIIQRLLADKPMHELEAQLYQNAKINRFQRILSDYSKIEHQKCIYTPYKDTALFGNYFFGTPDSVPQMAQLTNQIFYEFSQNISENELNRAKNKLYIELLLHETGNDISQAIGNQILYFNRRVFRSEIAKRVANYSVEDIQKIIQKWCINKPQSITVWGNELEQVKQQIKDKQ